MRKIWGLQVDFETLDIGNGFLIVKSDMMEDYTRVYTCGPWVVMDHYVTVRKWQHDFKSIVAEEDTTAIPNLPIEYYNEKVLFHIAKILGKPLKVDINTAMAARGKYARMCVEMDLRKPLISHFVIGTHNYVIEYEHLHTFCFFCGRIGHRKDNCSERLQRVPEKTNQIPSVAGQESHGPSTSQNPSSPKFTKAEMGPQYGPWTKAPIRRKQNTKWHLSQKPTQQQGNRFEVLQEDRTFEGEQPAQGGQRYKQMDFKHKGTGFKYKQKAQTPNDRNMGPQPMADSATDLLREEILRGKRVDHGNVTRKEAMTTTITATAEATEQNNLHTLPQSSQSLTS